MFARAPFVIKHLWPLSIYSSPERLAVVFSAPASEPASGSVTAKAVKPSFSSTSAKRLRWRSVPAMRSGLNPRPLAPRLREKPASPQDSSSRIRQEVTFDTPVPPYSAGRSRQLSCILQAFL